MRYVLSVLVSVLLAVSLPTVALVLMADRVSAETITSSPEPVEEGASSGPIRIRARYGDRVWFGHEGPFCWDFRVGPRGGARVVVIQDEREYRGEPCEGRRTAVVRLPRGIQDDGVYLWSTPGRVHVWVLEPGSF